MEDANTRLEELGKRVKSLEERRVVSAAVKARATKDLLDIMETESSLALGEEINALASKRGLTVDFRIFDAAKCCCCCCCCKK